MIDQQSAEFWNAHDVYVAMWAHCLAAGTPPATLLAFTSDYWPFRLLPGAEEVL